MSLQQLTALLVPHLCAALAPATCASAAAHRYLLLAWLRHHSTPAPCSALSRKLRYDNLTNDYAALLEPDPRTHYRYFVVLPTIDRDQLPDEEVSGGMAGENSHQRVLGGGGWFARPLVVLLNRRRTQLK